MLKPGQEIERYIVESMVGEGGMAVVYLVRHSTLGTRHALKVLTLVRRDIKERLIQEGQLQAGIKHRNVVAVTDVLDINGAPALLMEFVKGPPLDRWLMRYRPTLKEALAVFRAIAAGVGAAHSQGLIHRDLKPANVMLQISDDGITAKVTDFGLAKALDTQSVNQTRSGTTMGTPAYMAPEQIRDASKVDNRADMYSLGCLLYELVCGRPPFQGNDIIELFNAVSKGDFSPPRVLAPNLPDPVVEAIEGLMQLDPEERIPNWVHLFAILDGEPRPKTLMGDVSPASPPLLRSNSPGARVVKQLAQVVPETPPPPGSYRPRSTPGMDAPRPVPTENAADATFGSFGPGDLPPSARKKRVSQVRTMASAALLVVATLVGCALLVLSVIAITDRLRGPPSADTDTVVIPVDTETEVPVPDPESDTPPEPSGIDTEEDTEETETDTEAGIPVQPPPRPPPRPVDTATSSFVVQGDARSVRLESVQTGLSYSQGEKLEPGQYRIQAWFEGRPDPVKGAKINLADGERATIRCSAALYRCTK